MYRYMELFNKATAAGATQADINNLGEWFEMFGMQYWNGEYFDADEFRLYPVYLETPLGLYIDGYEFK